MNINKPVNSYDDTKNMLNKIRQIQKTTKSKYGIIKEQVDSENGDDFQSLGRSVKNYMDSNNQPKPAQSQPSQEDNDYIIINDVEVVIHSEDPEDLELNDEEKGKISQLIDDFRAEVSETAEFGSLNVYESNSKLDGKLSDIGLQFTLSTGDDTGLYINGQMLKVDQNILLVLGKLITYQLKFSSTINDLLVRRRAT